MGAFGVRYLSFSFFYFGFRGRLSSNTLPSDYVQGHTPCARRVETAFGRRREDLDLPGGVKIWWS